MFNKDFYPTPTKVLDYIYNEFFCTTSLLGEKKDLFAGSRYIHDYQAMNILEPSAGSGNIIEYLNNRARVKRDNIFACEKESKLLDMLQGKCNILGSDFLTLDKGDVCHIDLVVANPPFSEFKAHFEHLIEIVPNGAKVICLCNYDSCISGRASKSVNNILDQYKGTLENLGNVFSEAERSTDINIGLIYLQKGKKDDNFDFSVYFSEKTDEYEQQENAIMSYDYVREVVNRYVEACKNWGNIKAEQDKMNTMIKGLKINYVSFKAVDDNKNEITSFSQFKQVLQRKCWNNIFNKMKMDKYLTNKSKVIIEEYIKNQTKFPFTMKNVYNMIRMILGTQKDRMKDAVLEAFDTIASFSYEKNTSAGFKTNSDYMINQKFIMPHIGSMEWDRFELSRCGLERVSDIEKALCFLTAKNYNTIKTIQNALGEHSNSYFIRIDEELTGKWIESEFFKFKVYKKGTCHFQFLDENVWAKFNQIVASERGWNLPDLQKRKTKANNKFK